MAKGYSLMLLLLCIAAVAKGQEQFFWHDIGPDDITDFNERYSMPLEYRLVAFDLTPLKQLLVDAPPEFTAAKKHPVIAFPLPGGRIQHFALAESPMMEAGLAARFPLFKTYGGQGVEDPTATIKISITDLGLHVMILSAEGAYFIDPFRQFNKEQYICYEKSSLKRRSFICETADELLSRPLPGHSAAKSHGTQLRTYRLAVAATGEYTAFYGGTVSGAMSGIVASVNRVNGVYENELAVRLTLIANNNLIVYTNSATDPYTNNNGSTMLGENQSNIDAVIGSANYDVGHVFSTGGGGIASLGVPCRATLKARGVTGSSSPVADAFDIDYVAHEMGHQFGANHTFNSITGNCSGGNRNASTAYEPGSGITIMAYAGICGTDDLAPHSIAYFHTKSFEEITNYITGVNGNSCPVLTGTGNTPPVVNAGADYSIPVSTPFVLTGSATDADGDPLVYSWEEFDLGSGGAWNFQSSGNDAPIFRPFPPVTTPSRTFPQLSDIINNTTTIGEVLPAFARTLDFRLTARDNRAGGGGVTYNDVTQKVNVIATGAAFAVTYPNTAVNVIGGNLITVTWNISGTTAAPISCSNVKISLSTNGGNSFATVLTASTANDGSETVTVPNISTSQARIKVEAIGNIFFDMSNVNFTIQPSSPVITTISTNTPQNTSFCGGDTLTVSFTTDGPANAGNIFSAQLSNASGSFASPVIIGSITGTTSGSILCTLPQNSAQGSGYRIRIVSSNPAVTGSDNGSNLTINQIVSPTISAAGSTTICEPSGVTLSFTPVSGQQYQWTKNGVSIAGQTGSSYMATSTGNYAIVTSATPLLQQTVNSTSSVTILDNSCSTPSSNISVSGYTQTIPTAQITITVNISHTWVGDLVLFLEAPNGQRLALSDRTGNASNSGNDFINTVFSDAGASQLPTTGAPYTGTYKPWTSLVNLSACSVASTITTFSGFGSGSLNPNGQWRLRVFDRATSDVGVVNSWSITFPSVTSPCTSTSNSIAVTVNPQPVVTSFSPPSATEGSMITVNGTGFINVSQVSFNGSSASFTVINDTVINATVPPGASTGFINVTTACGNDDSPSPITIINDVTLNLSLYIEGLYNAGGIMTAAVSPYADSVTVQLVEPSSLNTIAFSAVSVLSTSGSASLTFPPAANGNQYYIVIRHRNSIETWSKQPVLFSTTTSFSLKN